MAAGVIPAATVLEESLRDAAFHAYFEEHHASMSRLAYLMTGKAEIADDLAADALAQVWRHGDRVTGDPIAYGYGLVLKLARRRNWRPGPRNPLRRLSHRRRACVVLRYAFDMSEREVAEALNISVGAVRSATSRGARQLGELLGGDRVAMARIDGWEAAR